MPVCRLAPKPVSAVHVLTPPLIWGRYLTAHLHRGSLGRPLPTDARLHRKRAVTDAAGLQETYRRHGLPGQSADGAFVVLAAP